MSIFKIKMQQNERLKFDPSYDLMVNFKKNKNNSQKTMLMFFFLQKYFQIYIENFFY